MNEKRVLNRKEAAKFLGIATSHLDKLAARGALPRIRIGRRVVFDVSDLEEFLRKNKDYGRK